MENLRKQFPQLAHSNIHYLDSASSSLTPEVVIEAMDNYYRNYRANIHRGLYKEAVMASNIYEATREKVAKLVNADPSEIIFTSGSTAASNMLVRMLEGSIQLNQGDEILTSVMEHHSTLVPLQELAKRKQLVLRYIPIKDSELDITALPSYLTDKTKIVSVMHVSNVLGTINPIKRITQEAHRVGALMLVDATASVGHISVDVEELDCDALYFSGHKMFGPTGVGVLWVKKALLEKLSPSTFGGDMVERVTQEGAIWAEIPQRFEAGTPSIASVIGLSSAVDFINSIGIEAIAKYNSTLFFKAVRALEQIEGVKILSSCDVSKNIGTIAFTIDGAHPHDIAQILADHGVAVRAGHHCAMPLHTALGVSATTRVSIHIYNDEEDIKALVNGIVKVKKVFSQ